MRDPTVRATAAAEAKRVKDAIDEARYRLFSMFRWLCQDKKNPNRYEYVVSLCIRLLNDTEDDKIRKADQRRVYYRYRRNSAAPDNLEEIKDFLTPIHSPDARNKIISDLQQVVSPQGSRPGPDNTLRDLMIADIIENIRHCGFDPTRGDEARWRELDPLKSSVPQSACSIVAMAWRQLESEVRKNKESECTGLLKGFAPLKSCPKPLSERSLQRIWGQSEWGALHGQMKARGIR